MSEGPIAEIVDASRNGSVLQALNLQCKYTIGHHGYLALNSLVLHPLNSKSSIYCLGGHLIDLEYLEPLSDCILANMGIQLSVVRDFREATNGKHSQYGLAIRIGLLYQTLDRSHEHLSARYSSGKRLCNHPSLKQKFARLASLCLRLTEKLRIYQALNFRSLLIEEHDELLESERQAEKLMGGHGFLFGGSHELTYLSMLVYCMNVR